MEVVGESVLSATLEVLFGKLASPELLKFARRGEVIAELENWKKELMMTNEVLDEAEEKQTTKPSVKNWLDDLRDLAYDMEDVLDELATELLRRRLMAEGADQVATTSKVRSLIPTCFTGFNPVGEVRFNIKMGTKIQEITRRLDDISCRKAKLGFHTVPGVEKSGERFACGATSTWQRPPTTSLIDEPVHGRDDDKKVIIGMLLKDEGGESNFGVIPIVGIGGMGKTTLAQLIYRDDEIVKHFEPRVWVCVSDESDVEKLTKIILNAFSPDEIRDGDDFNQVQLKLSKTLVGKRFLLVLDDVWNINNYEQWSHLQTPFKSGARGSKIVVTTRHTNVASLMRADNYHHLLKPLSNDDCWNVFVKHAFENKNIDEHPNLGLLDTRIIEKCSGLPLAAKVLGGLLRSKPQNQWEHVLSSKMWNRSGVIPVLRLSYQHLPSHLKRCFAYCALFPRDYKFEQKELILLWIAEGLIHEAEEEKCQMEDLGADYFDELLSRCFFQPSSNSKSQFIMHDLINDLAQDDATEICFNLENIHKTSEMTRHLSFIRSEYDVFKKFEVLNKPEQLRTFVALPVTVDNKMKCYLSTKVLHGLLPKLIQLRVLSLSGYEINELPNSIGDLKHLRYLNLSHTKLKWLPEAVSSLYNLQSLILCNCMELIKLPICIMNLTNFRHLDISGSTMLEEMPPQVGSLVNLQTLSKFFLSKDNGSRIKELKNLLNLRGELAIVGLENVLDPRDAMYVNLKEIPNIEDLIMVWSEDSGNSRNESTEIEVLKWLQPHQSLKKLEIALYGGSKFPHWIGDPSFSKMVCLELTNCKNCTSLPALGGLPFLKDLVIKGMNQVKSIGDGFYGDTASPFQSLESLRFENMAEWNNWLIPKLGHEETEALFPSLHELMIIKCPKLINLPHELPSLVVFFVKECQELEMSIPRLPLLTKLIVVGSLKSWDGDVPSLTQLRIWGISRLSCLWERLAQRLMVLEDLGINECDELACLRKPGFGLENLGGLRHLWINGCDGVVSLEEQGLPCNLQYLEVNGCSNLEKLPNALHTLTSLAYMIIDNCLKLVSFPETGLPPMLRDLSVRNCEGLEILPDGMMINSCALEYLEIKDCPSLIGFPKGELPVTLKKLIIENCEKLESLPERIDNNYTCRLEKLHVWGCPSLKSIPRGYFPSTLEKLAIWDCEQLESIPGNLLENLTSLRLLTICNCPDVVSSPEAFLNPNLKQLSISDCENMRWPLSGWGLRTLTSLDKL
ncbi:putative disease resistance RPP13-like protein 1 [Vitis riparia]|uniref:putative disease resistance RPP13-like protein 1 n=1 Tax=Vitis riparia TaxID=96939 RepID=UPI00155A76DB|nr:putative disease resistance RPP13-like protein 1 [Vitis riparia]XP_034691092.1 putative disease resistance RPP13-like protein 1 [Vitis riparia]XP_034691093.1 putative disease resistance RPP13-like protein 1 [Vitis riparia]